MGRCLGAPGPSGPEGLWAALRLLLSVCPRQERQCPAVLAHKVALRLEGAALPSGQRPVMGGSSGVLWPGRGPRRPDPRSAFLSLVVGPGPWLLLPGLTSLGDNGSGFEQRGLGCSAALPW